MKILILMVILLNVSSYAQDKSNVRYEYKKFEKFDFTNDSFGIN